MESNSVAVTIRHMLVLLVVSGWVVILIKHREWDSRNLSVIENVGPLIKCGAALSLFAQSFVSGTSNN